MKKFWNAITSKRAMFYLAFGSCLMSCVAGNITVAIWILCTMLWIHESMLQEERYERMKDVFGMLVDELVTQIDLLKGIKV
jgi:hypothetical protein